ncbi:Uncharacterized protein Adt_03453 [Abeliophyllum distichum]|uniref:Uncharacterized protein n=1 Tax=Abeliophyllum distichum TaxID=126358 RepID=A0ABD1VYI8_9LAMI
MADVMSHGGDGACDPLHQPSRTFHSSCEFVSPSKRLGISRGINLEKAWQANEKRPLSMAFDNIEQTIKNNMKYFMRLIGNQSYFDLQNDWSPDKYHAFCAFVDFLAADRYRDYKFKAHNHLKEHGPSRPYGELSTKEWQNSIYKSYFYDDTEEVSKDENDGGDLGDL